MGQVPLPLNFAMPKRKRSSRDCRFDLSFRINQEGSVVMPCHHCVSRGFECRMLPNRSRCNNRVRVGRSCDAEASGFRPA